jgi:molybdopterin-guanine dinucleotide biosynthesis protein MobB
VIPFVSLVGYSNSGKTTVMVSLIKILENRGYKVAAVKHAAHGYILDHPGTDSWQYAEAGADQVVVVGPKSSTSHEFFPQEKSLEQILDRIKDVDIILVEGFKREPGPKIEVFRREIFPDRITMAGRLLAIVSDTEITGETPQFSFAQCEDLADLIVRQVLV